MISRFYRNLNLEFKLTLRFKTCVKAVLLFLWMAACHSQVSSQTSSQTSNKTLNQSNNAMHHKKMGLGSSLAISPEGVLWVIGVNQAGDLFIQSSENFGKDWNSPQTIHTSGQSVLADGQNRPKLVFRSEHDWLITYTTPRPKPYTGDVMFIRSNDGGHSFSSPQMVHKDRQMITHRFESTQIAKDGTVHVLWIDKRDLEQHKTQAKTYRGAAIYYSQQTPEQSDFIGDYKIADHSCECCQIASVVARNGDLVAMWRHVFEPNIRDHALMRFQPSINTFNLNHNKPIFKRATFDQWALAACPHQGPAIAEDNQSNLHALWFTMQNNAPSVRYGRFNLAGDAIGKITALPDPEAEFADIATTENRVWIVWRIFDGKHFHLRLQENDLDGNTMQIKTIASTDQDNDSPRLSTWGKNAFVLWRTPKDLQVFQLNENPNNNSLIITP